MHNWQSFSNSRQVNIGMPIGNHQINNLFGKNWNSISHYVLGLSDARARVGTLTNPWNAKSCELMAPPKLTYIQDTLSDLLDSRALEINEVAKQSNKQIAIMWSGGIDSTSIVAAFIKNLPKQDLANIVIFLTSSSILENSQFFQKFIVPNFILKSYFTLDVTDEFFKKYILLHGDPGDCLFGPSIPMYQHLLSSGNHLKSWKNQYSQIILGIDSRDKNSALNGFGTWYVDKITNNLLETATPGIDTVADWWWWHYFNFKWEFSIWRPLVRSRTNIKDPISIGHTESYVTNTFFNTPKFQLWSYSNLATHVGKNKQDHKMKTKQYIFELDSNQYYFANKTKVESAPKNWTQLILPLYYDKHWVGHYLHEDNVQDTALALLESFRG